jgi:hypothetical protein
MPEVRRQDDPGGLLSSPVAAEEKSGSRSKELKGGPKTKGLRLRRSRNRRNGFARRR